MANNSKDCNVLVIGAGPYGLSSAAYLRSAGVETRVVGDPMSFWEKQMPKGMFLRSGWKASTIADPRAEVTLDALFPTWTGEASRRSARHLRDST